jgi:hypothetical protein
VTRVVAPNQYSPIATRVTEGVRSPALSVRRDPWGVCVHTSGRGVVSIAKQEKRSPLAVALEHYLDSQNGSNGYMWGGPAYVIDHDGTRHQIAPDDAYTHHAGSQNRPAYLSGHWEAKCSGAALAAWRKAWPGHRHPYSLFPSKSPNADYIGIEMIPVGAGFGVPMRLGLLFTREQHESVAMLSRDIGMRHGFPEGWARSPRLVGHEDVDLLERMDSHGGWDPGCLRAQPYFDFAFVRAAV